MRLPAGNGGAPFELVMLDAVVVRLPPGPRDQPRDLGIGSLSGLAQDPRSGRYLAVSDDRGFPRLVWLDIVVADGRLRVTPGQMLRVRAAEGVDTRRAEGADLEAVVSLPDGSWVVGEEGHYPPDSGGGRAPGEWPLRYVLGHIVGAERRFFSLSQIGVTHFRAG